MNLKPRISTFQTPDGEVVGYVRSSYVGLRGQERVEIVGPMGRVFHYDEDEVTSDYVRDPDVVEVKLSDEDPFFAAARRAAARSIK